MPSGVCTNTIGTVNQKGDFEYEIREGLVLLIEDQLKEIDHNSPSMSHCLMTRRA